MHVFQRDVHYIVRDGEVQIVDKSTGRIFEDRTWSDGLHQAVEARESLTISRETLPLAKITRQRFYRCYRSLGGMTGTAKGCEHEFATVYGLPVSAVPLRIPTKRIILPEHLSLTWQEKLRAIGDETETIIRAGRAVLIGTLNIAESVEVASELTARGLRWNCSTESRTPMKPPSSRRRVSHQRSPWQRTWLAGEPTSNCIRRSPSLVGCT